MIELGRAARKVKPFRNSSRYLYFVVDDSFKWADAMDATLEVDYFDATAGKMYTEFDGTDATSAFNGAYSRSENEIPLLGDKSWKTARFELRGARFISSQNNGADFRLVGESPGLVIGRVQILRH